MSQNYLASKTISLESSLIILSASQHIASLLHRNYAKSSTSSHTTALQIRNKISNYYPAGQSVVVVVVVRENTDEASAWQDWGRIFFFKNGCEESSRTLLQQRPFIATNK
jgi:hypothetical protein